VKVVALVLALGSAGCLRTLYEPTICTDERWDTTSVIAEGERYFVRPECETWRALADSTLCWRNDGERVEC